MYLDRMDYHETYGKGEHEYVFKGECDLCKSKHSVIARGSDLFNFRKGMAIQQAFPHLTSGDREFLMSGTCEKCWDKMFPEEEE